MPRKALRRSGQAVATASASRPPALWIGYLITAVVAGIIAAGSVWLAVHRSPGAAAVAPPAPTAADLVAAGNTAFDRKDWLDAATAYSQAIASGQDNPDVRTDLGTVYRNLNQPQKALTEYGVAQREDPGHQNSLINEGIVYAFDLHEPGAAMSAWHRYLQRFPHGEHTADVKRMMMLAGEAPAAGPRP